MSISAIKIRIAKNSSIVLLLVSVVLAAAAAWSIIKINSTVVSAVPVVVAKVNIEPHTVISTDMLEIQEYAFRLAKKGMFAKTENVVGKVNRTYIPAGTPVYIQQLATAGDNTLTTALSELKNPEYRAKSIPVEPIFGLDGRLKPGDRVDLIGAMRLPLKGQQTVVAQTFAKDVLVLEVMGDGGSMRGIIVAVTPQQAQEMDFVSRNGGHIGISLRPYQSGDTYTVPTTPESFMEKFLRQEGGGK